MTKIISNKSSADLDYPIVRPSLDLDFTQEELDPRITFSRGSIGTRVNRNRLIETVDANQPRFDYDPVTGECKGLLIEESRQNLLTYSEDFSNAVWGKTNITIQTNAITAPDGTTTADKLIGNTTNGNHNLSSPFFIFGSNGYKLVFSCYAKAAELTKIAVGFDTLTYAIFDLEANNVPVITNGYGWTTVSPSLQILPNGWRRCSLYVNTNGIEYNIGAKIFAVNRSNSISFTGDNTSGVYIWGAQVEAGSFPTSYIPTSGSTVTRSADLASMTGTNFSSWYNSTEGTIYSNVNFTENLSTSNFSVNNIIYSINNNTLSNRITLFGQNASKSIIPRYVVSGFTYSNPIVTISSRQNKFTHSFKSTDVSLVSNGGTPSISRIMAVTYPTVNQFEIGGQVGPSFNGTISRLTYYPRALKPNQLQYLTQ